MGEKKGTVVTSSEGIREVKKDITDEKGLSFSSEGKRTFEELKSEPHTDGAERLRCSETIITKCAHVTGDRRKEKKSPLYFAGVGGAAIG